MNMQYYIKKAKPIKRFELNLGDCHFDILRFLVSKKSKNSMSVVILLIQ